MMIEIKNEDEKKIKEIKRNEGLKSEEETIKFLIEKYEEENYEIRKEYIKKIESIKKEGFEEYKSIEEFKKKVENEKN